MKGVGIAAGLDAPTTIRRRRRRRRRGCGMTATAPRRAEPKKQRHTWADLYHERTHFQFIERSWRWAMLSGTLILISVARVRDQGPQPRHRLRGRHAVAVHRERRKGSASAGDVRDVLDPLGLGDAKVLIVGDNSVRVQSKDLEPRRAGQGHRRARRSTREHRRRAGERHQRRAHLGRQGEQQGAHRAHRVLLRDRGLPHVPLRVAHGARRDHRGGPRHHHHRRRVRGHRVRGDTRRPSSRSSPSSGSRSTTPSSCSTR